MRGGVGERRGGNAGGRVQNLDFVAKRGTLLRWTEPESAQIHPTHTAPEQVDKETVK